MVVNTEELTSSQADTPASPSQLREIKRRKKITATSGRKCSELLHKQNPLGSYVKTFMATSNWDWMTCSMTWKVKATPRNRLLLVLEVQEGTITGEEFILWPTPQAMDSMTARSPEAMKKQMLGSRKGRKKIATMKDAAVYGIYWTGEAVRQGEGELNPRRLEWQMNYPEGWTEIE